MHLNTTILSETVIVFFESVEYFDQLFDKKITPTTPATRTISKRAKSMYFLLDLFCKELAWSSSLLV